MISSYTVIGSRIRAPSSGWFLMVRFLLGQLSGFVQNRRWHTDFPEIVEKCAPTQDLEFLDGEIKRQADFFGNFGDPF